MYKSRAFKTEPVNKLETSGTEKARDRKVQDCVWGGGACTLYMTIHINEGHVSDTESQHCSGVSWKK